MLKTLNEKLTGLRGILLVWISALGVLLDQLAVFAETTLTSNATAGVVIAGIMTLKLAFTDFFKKIKS